MKLKNIIDWKALKAQANVSEWYVIDDDEARKVAAHFIDKGIEAGIEVTLRDMELEIRGYEDGETGVALHLDESFDFGAVAVIPIADLATEAVEQFGFAANWDDGESLRRIIADVEAALEILRADLKNFGPTN